MSVTRAHARTFELRLTHAGFLDAGEEVRLLHDAAQGDLRTWRRMIDRRERGEPLEWLIGYAAFLGGRVRVDRGVFVPRPQSELIARRAIRALPNGGIAADLCTGSGAIAVALRRARPSARVVATDIDDRACRCAASNDVEVYRGHLGEPLLPTFSRRCDVVVAVVPYVPTDEIAFLPRDVRAHEPVRALDGGATGTQFLEAAITSSARLLRPGGSLVLELGGNQDELLAPRIAEEGFRVVERLEDDDGDVRGIHVELVLSRRVERDIGGG